MGKGSGSCDERGVITIAERALPRPSTIADELTLQPRKKRTVWETVDDRFKFVRFKHGWAIAAQALYAGPMIPAPTASDRQALVGVGLLDSSYAPLVCFETLREARAALQLVGSAMDNPPDTRIQQRAIAYIIDPLPYKISRVHDGWEVTHSNGLYGEFWRLLKDRLGNKTMRRYVNLAADTYDFNTAITSLNGIVYPTRKAAFMAVQALVADIEVTLASYSVGQV